MSTLPLKKTKIFIRNVTVLDAGVLHSAAGPKGSSWHVDVALQGTRDAEGILMDFSLAKKCIKKSIDEQFDHRLFVGKSDFKFLDENRVAVLKEFEYAGRNSVFSLNTPAQAIAVFDDADILTFTENQDTKKLAEAISKKIIADLPSNVTALEVVLRKGDQAEQQNHFTYTHSLKYHDGNCQRFHGHSNIVEVMTDGVVDMQKSVDAAKLLDGRYLVCNDYVTAAPDDRLFVELFDVSTLKALFETHAFLEYTGSQGRVACIVPKPMLCLMATESTIENIADWLHNALDLGPSHEVCAYEGLQKGAMSGAS